MHHYLLYKMPLEHKGVELTVEMNQFPVYFLTCFFFSIYYWSLILFNFFILPGHTLDESLLISSTVSAETFHHLLSSDLSNFSRVSVADRQCPPSESKGRGWPYSAWGVPLVLSLYGMLSTYGINFSFEASWIANWHICFLKEGKYKPGVVVG